MIDTNYADDLVLLTNSSAQAKFLQHSLEQAAGRIDLQVNANKTEYMRFKWEGDISTQSRNLAAVSHLLKVVLTYA